MSFHTSTTLDPSFDKDIRDLHLVYDYSATTSSGEPTTWRYELWCATESRVVYSIHGGPMAGRHNYQTCTWQCIRPGELWQCNWLEETGTVVSLVYDIPRDSITTLIAFSRGHWDNAADAKGDKRNPRDFERWRHLARVDSAQSDRFMLSEQATVAEKYKGRGSLDEFDPKAETL